MVAWTKDGPGCELTLGPQEASARLELPLAISTVSRIALGPYNRLPPRNNPRRLRIYTIVSIAASALPRNFSKPARIPARFFAQNAIS